MTQTLKQRARARRCDRRLSDDDVRTLAALDALNAKRKANSKTLDEAEAFMRSALRRAKTLVWPGNKESVALVAHGLIVFYASAKLREGIEGAIANGEWRKYLET